MSVRTRLARNAAAARASAPSGPAMGPATAALLRASGNAAAAAAPSRDAGGLRAGGQLSGHGAVLYGPARAGGSGGMISPSRRHQWSAWSIESRRHVAFARSASRGDSLPPRPPRRGHQSPEAYAAWQPEFEAWRSRVRQALEDGAPRGFASQRRCCRSAALPSHFSRSLNRSGERMSAH